MNYQCKSEKLVGTTQSKKKQNNKQDNQNQHRFPNPLNNNQGKNMNIQCKVLKQLSKHEYLTSQMVDGIKIPNNGHASKRSSSFQRQLAIMQEAVKKQQKKCQIFTQPIKHLNWIKQNQIDDLLDLGFQSSDHHLNINTFLYNKTENGQFNKQPINVQVQNKNQKHVGFQIQNIMEQYYIADQNRESDANGSSYLNSGKSIDMLSENYQNVNCAPVFYSECHIRFGDILEDQTDLESEIALSNMNSISELPLYSSHFIDDSYQYLPLYSRNNIGLYQEMMAE